MPNSVIKQILGNSFIVTGKKKHVKVIILLLPFSFVTFSLIALFTVESFTWTFSGELELLMEK